MAGTDPDATDLLAVVGELVVKSPEFSRMWERYDVRRVGHGQKTFLHPHIGTSTLAHELMEIERTDGQRVVVYTAEPGTPDHDAMVLLDLKGAELPAAADAPTRRPEAASQEPALHVSELDQA